MVIGSGTRHNSGSVVIRGVNPPLAVPRSQTFTCPGALCRLAGWSVRLHHCGAVRLHQCSVRSVRPRGFEPRCARAVREPTRSAVSVASAAGSSASEKKKSRSRSKSPFRSFRFKKSKPPPEVGSVSDDEGNIAAAAGECRLPPARPPAACPTAHRHRPPPPPPQLRPVPLVSVCVSSVRLSDRSAGQAGCRSRWGVLWYSVCPLSAARGLWWEHVELKLDRVIKLK